MKNRINANPCLIIAILSAWCGQLAHAQTVVAQNASPQNVSPQYKFGSDPLDNLQPEPLDSGSKSNAPAQFGKPRDDQGDSSTNAPAQTPQHAVHGKLMGGISHSEVLSPIAGGQGAGKSFSSQAIFQMLKKPSGPAKRFAVPNWLAGTWSRSETTEVSRISLPDGRNVRPGGPSTTLVIDRFGTSKDAHGQVWQSFNPSKSTGEIDRGQSIDFHSVFGYRIVIVGPNSVVVEVQAAHAIVDKKTSKVSSFYQDEELNIYSSLADGMLRTDSSVKVFDMKGKPLFLARSVSTEKRTQTFK